MLDIFAMVALCLIIVVIIWNSIKELDCSLFHKCYHHEPEHKQPSTQPLSYVVDVDDSSPEPCTVIRIGHFHSATQTSNPVTSCKPVLSHSAHSATNQATTTIVSSVEASNKTASPIKAPKKSFLSIW